MVTKKTNKRHRFVLETSVQIDKITNSRVQGQIQELKSQGDLRSSHFILYEFKVGIMKDLIDFYFLVQLEGLQGAISQWKDSFKPRKIKNVLVSWAILEKLQQKTSSDDPLISLEAAIMHIFYNFDSDIQNKMVGGFAGDPIVKYKIEGEADFRGFLDLCATRKSIPLEVFFKSNLDDLNKIINAKDVDKLKEKKLVANMVKISNNPTEADKYHTNRAVGDVVISMDTPGSYELVTLDRDYTVLCGALGKKVRLLAKNQPRK